METNLKKFRIIILIKIVRKRMIIFKYCELVSLFFQNINRSLLHWLKMWDYVVFGKDLPLKPKDKKEKKKEDNKKKKKLQFEVQDELDQYHRPVQKVCFSTCHLSILCT